MKKIIIILLHIVLAIIFAGCMDMPTASLGEGNEKTVENNQTEIDVYDENVESCKKVLERFIYAIKEKDVAEMLNISAYNKYAFSDAPPNYSYEQIVDMIETEIQKSDTYYTIDSYELKTAMEMQRERINELNNSNELKGKIEEGIVFYANISDSRHFKGGKQSQTHLSELEFVKIENIWYIVER